MKVLAVLGGQWGDEGKGKLVDLFSNRFDIVARYHGGHNAGHTVKFGTQHFALHLLPAGIVRGRPSVIGPGVVVDLEALLSEMDKVRGSRRGDRREPAALRSRDRHPSVPPPAGRRPGAGRRRSQDRDDTSRNRAGVRVARRPARHPRRGALPSRDAGRARRGHRRRDGRAPARPRGIRRPVRRSRACAARARAPSASDRTSPTPADTCATSSRPVRRCSPRARTARCSTCPRARIPSSRRPTAPPARSHADSRSRRGPSTRASWSSRPTTTRVGEGPFPTELKDDTGEFLRKRGNEYGTSTGRPRRTGWFDAVVARTAVELSGAAAFALTKLDCLDELEEIPVCLGYRLDGKPISDLPALAEDVARLEPEYEKLPGWKATTTGVTRYEELPVRRAALRARARGCGRRAGRDHLHRTAARRNDLARRHAVSRGAAGREIALTPTSGFRLSPARRSRT